MPSIVEMARLTLILPLYCPFRFQRDESSGSSTDGERVFFYVTYAIERRTSFARINKRERFPDMFLTRPGKLGDRTA